MQKIMKNLLVWALLPLTAMDAATSSDECVSAFSALEEELSMQETFREMITNYNSTCIDEGLCTIDVDEATKYGMETMDANDRETPIPPIVGSSTMHFGKSFAENPYYISYQTACSDLGADITCIDGHIVMVGEAGAAFLKEEEGVHTDLEMKIFQYPVCVPEECRGEPMYDLLEQSGKNAILKSPAIAEELSPESEALIKSLTVATVCSLSGLKTCKLEVKDSKCAAGVGTSPASLVNKAGSLIGMLAITVSAFVTFM